VFSCSAASPGPRRYWSVSLWACVAATRAVFLMACSATQHQRGLVRGPAAVGSGRSPLQLVSTACPPQYRKRFSQGFGEGGGFSVGSVYLGDSASTGFVWLGFSSTGSALKGSAAPFCATGTVGRAAKQFSPPGHRTMLACGLAVPRIGAPRP